MATIHPTARIDASASVLEGAVIGARCIIEHGVTIERGVVIEDDVIVRGNSYIGQQGVVNNLTIGRGTVIGTGCFTIESSIGANCFIDHYVCIPKNTAIPDGTTILSHHVKETITLPHVIETHTVHWWIDHNDAHRCVVDDSRSNLFDHLKCPPTIAQVLGNGRAKTEALTRALLSADATPKSRKEKLASIANKALNLLGIPTSYAYTRYAVLRRVYSSLKSPELIFTDD